jgi:hypothetical protein
MIQQLIQHIWLILGGLSAVAVIGLVFLGLRMPVFRWYCRRCRKVVSAGRFHPAKCSCGTQALVAYFCKNCGSWNTTSTGDWHCASCSSKDISLGVEYHFATGLWRTRNQNTARSFFSLAK